MLVAQILRKDLASTLPWLIPQRKDPRRKIIFSMDSFGDLVEKGYEEIPWRLA